MSAEEEEALRRRIVRLEKINAALIERAERAPNALTTPYDLFRANVDLERMVRRRTGELRDSLRAIESMNGELAAARDAAERANRAKSRLLAHVGHDLLQPLGAARLFLDMLRAHPGDEDGALLARIDRAVATMETMLRDLMDLSRLESGGVAAWPRPLAVGDLLAELAADYGPVAARRGLELTVLPCRAVVRSDPAMLARLLRNLLSNALRYTRSGRVLVGCRRRGGALRIDVLDTGPGIAADRQDEIFEDFHHGDQPLPEGEVGHGLGLSIVRRLAETLGHGLSLESYPGRGTRFSVEVPLEAAAGEAEGDLGGALVLVMGGEAPRSRLAALLARWHCLPIQADGGGDAEAVAEEVGQRPDLLLICPPLAGAEARTAAARMRGVLGADLPVIVLDAEPGPAALYGLLRRRLAGRRHPLP